MGNFIAFIKNQQAQKATQSFKEGPKISPRSIKSTQKQPPTEANSPLPLLELPPEILLIILKMLVEFDSNSSYLNFMLICKKLRDVAGKPEAIEMFANHLVERTINEPDSKGQLQNIRNPNLVTALVRTLNQRIRNESTKKMLEKLLIERHRIGLSRKAQHLSQTRLMLRWFTNDLSIIETRGAHLNTLRNFYLNNINQTSNSIGNQSSLFYTEKMANIISQLQNKKVAYEAEIVFCDNFLETATTFFKKNPRTPLNKTELKKFAKQIDQLFPNCARVGFQLQSLFANQITNPHAHLIIPTITFLQLIQMYEIGSLPNALKNAEKVDRPIVERGFFSTPFLSLEFLKRNQSPYVSNQEIAQAENSESSFNM